MPTTTPQNWRPEFRKLYLFDGADYDDICIFIETQIAQAEKRGEERESLRKGTDGIYVKGVMDWIYQGEQQMKKKCLEVCKPINMFGITKRDLLMVDVKKKFGGEWNSVSERNEDLENFTVELAEKEINKIRTAISSL